MGFRTYLVINNHVTLGISIKKLKQQNIIISNCPFNKIPNGYENAIWIEPVVCTVEYMPSTKNGLRQAIFKGIRDDKLPEECKIGEQ